MNNDNVFSNEMMNAIDRDAAVAILELNADEKRGKDLSHMADDITEIHLALEELNQELSAINESGGLSVASSRIAASYSHNLLTMVGYKVDTRLIPTFENFKEYRSRYTSTAASIRNINVALEDIWKDIKKMLDEFIKWMRKQWLKLFSGAEQLKRRAQAVRSRAENNDFKDGTINKDDASGIAKKIILNGNVKKSDIAIIENVVRALPARWSDFVYDVSGKIEDIVNSVTTKKNPKKGVDEIMKILEAERSKILSSGTPMQKKGEGEDTATFSHQVLPGNAVIQLRVDSALEKCKLKLKSGNEEANKLTTLKALSREDVLELCDDIIDIADILIEFRKKSNKLDKATDRLEQAGRRLSSFNPPEKKPGTESFYLGFEADEPDINEKHDKLMSNAEKALGSANSSDAAVSTNYKAIGRFVNSFGIDLLKLPVDIYSHSVKTCYGYLDWCVESINAGS